MPSASPEPIDLAGVQRDPRAGEGAGGVTGPGREEVAHRDLAVAGERRLRGAADQDSARQRLPAGRLVERAQGRVAGEDPEVGAAGTSASSHARISTI